MVTILRMLAKMDTLDLVNPNLGEFLGVYFEVGEGKTTPMSKTCLNYARNLKFGM